MGVIIIIYMFPFIILFLFIELFFKVRELYLVFSFYIVGLLIVIIEINGSARTGVISTIGYKNHKGVIGK